MTSSSRYDNKFEKLRNQAEQLVNQSSSDSQRAPSDIEQLIHELQVHQIELQLQNDELRNTQQELEKSRSHYRDLFEKAPVGYLVINPSGVIKYSNMTFSLITGLEKEQLTGHPFAELLTDADKSIFRARLKAFHLNPEGKSITVRFKTAPPTELYLQLATSSLEQHTPSLSSTNDETVLLLAVTDVTDRMLQAKELLKNQKFTSDILDSLTDNICVIDEQGEIKAVNSSWIKFSKDRGFAPMLNGNYLEICQNSFGESQEYAQKFLAGIEQVRQGNKDAFELTYPCHYAETELWFIGKISRLSYGKEKYFIIAHQDITTQKKLEQQRIELEKKISLKTKSKSLQTMAGAVAHTINNQLSAVLGNLDLITPHTDLHSVFENVEEAKDAARRSVETGALLLTYLGQSSSPQAHIDIIEIITQAIQNAPDPGRNYLEFEQDGREEPLVIKGNDEQLLNVFKILITNSFESYHEGSGRVVFHTDIIDKSALILSDDFFPPDWQPTEKNYVSIAVEDDGCGIEPETVKHIFDPFFTTKFIGRGLGLAVLLGIVSTHGGGVKVVSAPNRGTTFTLYFPLNLK